MFREVKAARPDARFVYLADDAGFPYGDLIEENLVERVTGVLGRAIADTKPDLVVVACNTASTLALTQLRARFSVPFVGTVPAIKPACSQSVSKLVSVLGTQATVGRRIYPRTDPRVCVGLRCAPGRLAAARALCRSRTCRFAGGRGGNRSGDRRLFHRKGWARTDTIVLACTHYPLLLQRLRASAPWPVTWLDPAPAIARRVADLMRERGPGDPPLPSQIAFTSGRTPSPRLAAALADYGF